MKAAFNAQYQRMFVSAGVEGCQFTHPERVGEAALDEYAAAAAAANQQQSGRRKKSRWD